jgi:tRNA(fMet)-specific endonuclease VapC
VRYLLDTDHLSFLQLGAGREFTTLSARMARHSSVDFALSVVGFHEQMLGGHAYINRARTMRDVIRGYEVLSQVLQSYLAAAVLPFDAAAGTAFDGLISRRVRVGTMDLCIASIALSRGLTVLSRNLGDFGKVPGLVVEDWTA